VLDFLTGLTGLPMGDSESRSGELGGLLGFLGPIAGVSVFSKGLKGGRLAAEELKMMHGKQAAQSMDDLKSTLETLGLLGDVSPRQANRIKSIAEQYPRSMAHLVERTRGGGEINPRIGAYAEMSPQMGAAAGIDPHPTLPGRSTIGMAVNPVKSDPVKVFAEELAHSGQIVGLKEHAGPLYQAVKQAGVPYDLNPFEINAKVTANKLAPNITDRIKDLFGMGPSSVKQTPLLKQLQDLNIIPRDIPQGQIMEYLRKVGVPPGMATEPWANEFKAIKPPQIRSLMGGGS
jgi:hypothetical protein